MAVTNTTAAAPNPPMMTVAMLPGKPETKMRLADLQRKERQEQKEQDKKLDAPKNQPQSSTVVNISAKARELSRAAPVDQASSAAKTGSSTDQVAKVAGKGKETNVAAPVAQAPAQTAAQPSPHTSPATDIGSSASAAPSAKKA